jgi:hypothetical protein
MMHSLQIKSKQNKAGETQGVSFGTLLLAIKWPYSFRKEQAVPAPK